MLFFYYNGLGLRMNKILVFTDCTKIYLEVTVKNSRMFIRKCEDISLWIALHLGSILILDILPSSIQGNSLYAYIPALGWMAMGNSPHYDFSNITPDCYN